MMSKSERAIRQLLNDGEMEFRPNFTKLARQTGLPISSLWDGWQNVKRSGYVSVFAIIAEKKTVLEHRTVKQRLDPTKGLRKGCYANDGVSE